MQKIESQSDAILLAGRLLFSSLFLLYGWFSLTGFAGATAYMQKLGLPLPALFAAVGIIIELGGGMLVVIGYQFRVATLVLALYTLVAALLAHRDFANGVQLLNFMKNMAIAGGALGLAMSGPGGYSVDGRS